jgi:hypothetical protein
MISSFLLAKLFFTHNFQSAFVEFFDKIIAYHPPGQLAIHDYSGLIGGALIALGTVLLSIGEPPDFRPTTLSDLKIV